jgi:hypothetical protein
LKLRIRDPQEKAHLLALAAISLFELGSEDLATGQGEKALSLSTQFRDVDQLLFRLALAYHKLGDVKSFRRYRIWCSKSFPDNAWNRMLSKLG